LKFFFRSGFLSNLRLPWKQTVPWINCIENIFLWFRIFEQSELALKKVALKFSLYCNIVYHSGFLSNLRLPGKRSLSLKQNFAWKFSSAVKCIFKCSKKTRFASEQTMHPPKVSQNPNFIVILNAWTWIPMQTVLHELETFRNYDVTECRKNVPNAVHNACGWLIKYKHIAALYDEQERVCWMTLSIFALPIVKTNWSFHSVV